MDAVFQPLRDVREMDKEGSEADGEGWRLGSLELLKTNRQIMLLLYGKVNITPGHNPYHPLPSQAIVSRAQTLA